MTQAEKAKAYDEALEKARLFYKRWDGISASDSNLVIAEVKEIFPELKESEDERIRKSIIAILNNYVDNSNTFKPKMIAWLEKQEEKPVEEYNITGISSVHATGKLREIIKDIESEKVEPKFKIGDWIVEPREGESDGLWHIDRIEDGHYWSDKCGCTIEYADKNFHLWTIKDAKDGDVLQLGLVTAIFEKYIGNGCCTCYCSVWNGEFEIPRKDSSYGCHNATPATKEQRELLFKKMKEAGYKWDADKLIKVPKQKEPEGALKHLLDEQDKFYKEAKIVLEDKDTALAFLRRTGIIDENGELAEKYRSDQTPATTVTAWSDVDESMCQYVVNDLRFVKEIANDPNFAVNVEMVEKEINWLKSLKGRVQPQPKQEWSEEDETRIKNILSVLDAQVCWDGATGKKGNPYQKDIDWLKSLKDRNLWKPREEQMKALHDLNLTGNISYAGQGQTLIELYNDLQKLTE